MAPGRAPAASRTRPRLRPAVLALLVLLVLLAGACAKPYDPFRIPAGEVRERVDTIALSPLRIPADVGEREPLAPEIEQLVHEVLSAGGFRVVAAATSETLWQEHASGVGPIFDSRTGALDEERWEVVREAVYRDLASQHGADAVLDLWIAPELLYVPSHEPYLCGTRMRLYWPSGDPDGAVTVARGACLNARLNDLEGRVLYAIRAGLEAFETYANQTRARRPVAERFDDPAARREAVESVLGPLAERAGHGR